MNTLTVAKRSSPKALWTGRVIKTLVVLFMLFDAVGKFARPEPVRAAFERLGFPLELSAELGFIILLCTLFYIIPRTAVLGAILLTAFLGGAIATNLRARDPVFETWLFPVLIGFLTWAALWLENDRLKALFIETKI